MDCSRRRVRTTLRCVWTFPARWEELLWDAARAELPAAALEMRVLLPAIVERTRR